MRKGLAFLCLLIGVAVSSLAACSSVSFALPTNFVWDDAAPGAGFDTPTGMAFFPDGRMIVNEKQGVAWVVQNGVKLPVPLWSSTDEVLNNGDRGLISVAVDPNYASNHFIYFSYVVDPDSNGVDDNDVAFGRVTRYRTSAADSNVVDPTSRTILLGTTWADGVLSGSDSHTIDALRFGTDGSLLLTAGEGALYTQVDQGGSTPNLFLPGRGDPYEDIGSFRSQSVSSFGGKLIRINPLTGQGYPSNPFYDGNLNSKRSKIFAYGFRNPWRFSIKPNTGSTNVTAGSPGTIYVGNLGLNSWEALDVVRTGGSNFGWPCWEGPEERFEFTIATPAHNGCSSMGTSDNPSQRSAPAFYYNHNDSTLSSPTGLLGNGLTGGIFYNGPYYPTQYRGAYFFADFGQGWLKVATVDANDHVTSVADMEPWLAGPVDFATDPTTGDIYYVSIYDQVVRHLRWTGPVNGDLPPVAVASGTPTLGVAPLGVSFNTIGSSDPDGDPLTFSWNFGDGTGSTSSTPLHTYTTPGTYYSVLTASDGRGGTAKDTVIVVAVQSATFPTTNVLDDFNRADGALGGAWDGGTQAMVVSANTLALTGGGGWGLFDSPIFSANQEAYYTFNTAPSAAGQHNLYLKAQGTNLFDGCVKVSYDSAGTTASVWTYDSGASWVKRGGPYAASFAAGDRLGARAYADGSVQIFKNTTLLGTAKINLWPYYAVGGRVGLEMVSTTAHLDDFGGGDAVVNGNLPPTISIVTPANGLFYTAGDSIRLTCTATDDKDATAALKYRWDVDLNHNNHVHPGQLVSTNKTAAFMAQNHDDGSGVSYTIRLKVTDSGGLSSTKSVQIWPNVDLRSTSLISVPDTVTTSQAATYRFTVRNAGTMPAPFSHWQLTASNGVTLAQGDTAVAAGATVTIQRIVPPVLPAGKYTLRVMLDTLNTVHESVETNNFRTKVLFVRQTTAGVDDVVDRLALSAVYPNPGHGEVGLALDLPSKASVALSVFDLQGREVYRAPAQVRSAGHWNLTWSGRNADGAPSRAGLYLARVQVGERSYTRRFVLVE
jgi:glucose/arabinose dehydrogenase/PKD repeat protein